MATAKNDPTAAIKAANKNLSAGMAAGDPKAMAACYTKDAVLMPPNSKAFKGHTQIAKFWQGAMDMGIKSVTLTTKTVDPQGRTALEYGNATLKGARGKVLDKAKYVVVWKREGKDWKLHWDIFNSNNPA